MARRSTTDVFKLCVTDGARLGGRCPRWVFQVPVESVPFGLPTEANARQSNVKGHKKVYGEVDQSLRHGVPGTFELMNRGMILLARRVRQIDETTYELEFAGGQGVVDGGHTYDLLCAAAIDGAGCGQSVLIQVYENPHPDLVPAISHGLNNSIQVNALSHSNLAGDFDWLRAALAGEPYAGAIGYRSGTPGVSVWADRIIAILHRFDQVGYPDASRHPMLRASQVIDDHRRNRERYEALAPVVPDILRLADYLNERALDWARKRGRRVGNYDFLKIAPTGADGKRKPFHLAFSGKDTVAKLEDGILLALLGPFRKLLVFDPVKGRYSWCATIASREDLLAVAELVGRQLMDVLIAVWHDSDGSTTSMLRQQSLRPMLYYQVPGPDQL